MRALKLKEIEAVAGGGCGSRIPEYDAPWCDSSDPFHNNGGPDRGGELHPFHDQFQGGGGSNAESQYHIYLLDTDPEDLAFARSIEIALSALNNALRHHAGAIEIGLGRSVTSAQVLSTLGQLQFYVTPNDAGGDNGASAVWNGANLFLRFDPSHSNSVNYSQYGVAGIYYLILHEVGHALNLPFGERAWASEGAANTAARSLAMAAGLDFLPVEPGGGYE